MVSFWDRHQQAGCASCVVTVLLVRPCFGTVHCVHLTLGKVLS